MVEVRALRAKGMADADLPPVKYLAISGGGPDGAYGAGLLCGWTERGDRPVFKVVTGISTGALTAPFAYLGPEYDYVLREVYTKTRTKDILRPRNLLKGFYGDAMADTAPLWELLEKHVDQKILEAIAAEYAKGRLLLIGTTNLDSRRGVIWNIGAIATSGEPGALDLLRSILIASAAIPGAFPPVMIDVEAGGEKYQELHVDGGATAQVFLYPPSAHFYHRDRGFFIIRNSRLDADWAEVRRRTMSIAGRAISSLIQTQGIGDLYKLWVVAKRDGVDFNLAYIPADFKTRPTEEFDPVYMQQLFERGRQMSIAGYPWEKLPPGYTEEPPPGTPVPGSRP
jgi:predicted acylesterase/phospholipase RssA